MSKGVSAVININTRARVAIVSAAMVNAGLWCLVLATLLHPLGAAGGIGVFVVIAFGTTVALSPLLCSGRDGTADQECGLPEPVR